MSNFSKKENPEMKDILLKILKYHIIEKGALLSSNMKDESILTTSNGLGYALLVFFFFPKNN